MGKDGKKRAPGSAELERAALHEAAHAVVAVAFDFLVEEIVVSARRSYTRVLPARAPQSGSNAPEIAMLLAGVLAETRLGPNGREHLFAALSDHEKIERLGATHEQKVYAGCAAKRVLQDNWSTVEQLARTLVVRAPRDAPLRGRALSRLLGPVRRYRRAGGLARAAVDLAGLLVPKEGA